MQTTTDLLYTSHQWWLRCGAQELTTVVPSYLYSHPVTKQLFLFYTWGKWNTEDLSGTDMTLNLNIFPYTVPVPNSWQTPKQDGVSAPKYSNCDQWTSLLILFPCACFKASWYHRIASGVSVAQLLSCFQWGCLSDARSRESSFNDYKAKCPPAAPTQGVIFMSQLHSSFSCWPCPAVILGWDLESFRKGWGPGEMERCLLRTLFGIKITETLLMSL